MTEYCAAIKGKQVSTLKQQGINSDSWMRQLRVDVTLVFGKTTNEVH
jgi:hypothetical protein